MTRSFTPILAPAADAPQLRRRSALALSLVVAALAPLAALLAGAAPGRALAAGVALLALQPLHVAVRPRRGDAAWVALLAASAAGLACLLAASGEHAGAIAPLLALQVVWAASFLRPRLVVAALAVNAGAAAAALLAGGAGAGWLVAQTVTLAAVAALVHGLVDAVRGSRAAAAEVVQAIDDHLFSGEIAADGSYRERFTGPGLHRLLGGEPPAGADAAELWERHVHPDDWATYRRFHDALRRGEADACEYRLVGLDGRERWVWERARPRRLPDGRVVFNGIATDITARRREADELATARAEADRSARQRLEAVSRYERIVESSSDLILSLRPDGTIAFVNPAAHALLGRAPEDLVGTAWGDLVDDDQRHADARRITGDHERRAAAPAVTRLLHADGRMRVFAWSGGHDAASGLMTYVGRDVTADAEAREEAERRARVDPLTGVANRRHFEELLRRALAGAGPTRRPALLLLDVDHFKRVNDDHGHLVGDAVLVELCRRVRGAIRETDTLARWGGEEFAVVVPDVASDDALRRIAESVREAVAAAPFVLHGRILHVRGSVGGARAGDPPLGPDPLLAAADAALYAAKRAGRDTVRLAGDADASVAA